MTKQTCLCYFRGDVDQRQPTLRFKQFISHPNPSLYYKNTILCVWLVVFLDCWQKYHPKSCAVHLQLNRFSARLSVFAVAGSPPQNPTQHFSSYPEQNLSSSRVCTVQCHFYRVSSHTCTDNFYNAEYRSM